MFVANLNLSTIDLSKQPVHDVSAVFRNYFRELPEPLIPFELYEPLMKVQRDSSIPFDDRIKALKQVISKIPPENLPLLKYTINLLRYIEEYSDINKMTSSYVLLLSFYKYTSSKYKVYSNLAIVFGPNLIRPEVETIQNALEMPLLQGIIQLLIEYKEKFWCSSSTLEKRNQLKAKRVHSKLIVGSDFTIFDPNEEFGDESSTSALSFRSLTKPTPGYELSKSNDGTRKRSKSKTKESKRKISRKNTPSKPTRDPIVFLKDSGRRNSEPVTRTSSELNRSQSTPNQKYHLIEDASPIHRVRSKNKPKPIVDIQPVDNSNN